MGFLAGLYTGSNLDMYVPVFFVCEINNFKKKKLKIQVPTSILNNISKFMNGLR